MKTMQTFTVKQIKQWFEELKSCAMAVNEQTGIPFELESIERAVPSYISGVNRVLVYRFQFANQIPIYFNFTYVKEHDLTILNWPEIRNGFYYENFGYFLNQYNHETNQIIPVIMLEQMEVVV